MDSSQASSFIPKSPVQGMVNKRRVRKIYVLTYLITIFFFGSLLAAGGTFFYKLSVENKLDAVRVSLNEERNRFNQSDLERVSELDARMREAEKLLANQVSVAEVLKAVEDVTLASVHMNGFEYKKGESATLELALAARAADFNTTLFQRQVLSANEVLAGATVSNVSYGTSVGSEEGSARASVIAFTVSKELNPTLLVPAISAATTFSEPVTPSEIASTTDTVAPALIETNVTQP